MKRKEENVLQLKLSLKLFVRENPGREYWKMLQQQWKKQLNNAFVKVLICELCVSSHSGERALQIERNLGIDIFVVVSQ